MLPICGALSDVLAAIFYICAYRYLQFIQVGCCRSPCASMCRSSTFSSPLNLPLHLSGSYDLIKVFCCHKRIDHRLLAAKWLQHVICAKSVSRYIFIYTYIHIHTHAYIDKFNLIRFSKY